MSNKHLLPLLLCIQLLLSITVSCGGGSSPTTAAKPEFLYAIVLSGSPPNLTFQLASFKVNASTGALSSTGSLSLHQIVPGMAVDAVSKSLYLSMPQFGADSIEIFSIDSTTGVPSPVGAYSLVRICGLCAPPSGPGMLALDPSGRTLYYGSSTIGAGLRQGIGALAVNGSTGGLSDVAGSPFQVSEMPFGVLVHPSGQFLYTENLSASVAGGFTVQSISGFSVDASNGALTPVTGSPFTPGTNASLVGFAIHPSGKFLYVATGLAANGVLAWNIDSTSGALTALPGSPFAPGSATFGAAFDPAGRFLYMGAGAGGRILGFRVDASTGALTPLPGSPFTTGVVGDPVVDPSGRFLFASVAQSNAIAAFSIDATTGALTELGSPTTVSGRAAFMTIIEAP